MSDINIKKQVFDRSAFDNTINTTFTELTSSLNIIPTPTSITVSEFFTYYNDLFYNIPKFGETESHEYLIATSQQYVGPVQVDTELIDALIAEVTELRQDNLILQQDLANTAVKTAEEALTQLTDTTRDKTRRNG